MKARIYIFLLAAMALLASCNKELQEIETPAGQTGNAKTFLKIGIDTKTYLGESESGLRKVYWSNGDMISVNGNASDELENIEEGATSATFSFSGTLTPPYRVIYPAGIYSEAIVLPAIQDYKEGGFADNMFPMSGYSADGSDITLSHLCAIVKVSVLRAQAPGSDEDDLVSVRFKGRNDEQVSGIFRIDFENASISSESSAAEDKVVKVIKTLSTSTTTAVDYYIVVPAGTYANGFDVIVQDRNGHIMTKSKTDSKTLEAGHLYNMPEFEFIPTATELGVEISSAQDLIDFATAYNAKEYAGLGSSLVATVTADITFDATTSASFANTKGIGNVISDNETNYFNGVFNGNNHTISGLEATVPVFAYIGSGGVVKDLTLSNTCSFDFTHNNKAEGLFGSIVGYHKGKLNNVKSAADISLAAVADVTQMTTIGGLAGYANGGELMEGCEYSGLISTPAGFTSTNKLIIGGLVGRFKANGSVTGSTFKGAINSAAQITSTDKTNPYVIIGGVAGFLDGGARVNSCNSTADHALEHTAYSNFDGILVLNTTIAYHAAVGGIAGEVTNGIVSDCTNVANIACTVFKDNDEDAKARYIKSGGIAGRVNANGTVTGCTNNGAVQHRSNPRIQDMGGVVGYNAGTVTSCTNNALVSHMTTGITGASRKGGRSVSLGGVIGQNAAGATVSDVHNTGNLQISAMENGYDTTNNKPVCEARMGGVIAYNLAAIDGGASKNITNTGQVYFNCNFSYQFIGYEIGGVVGYSSASVQNVKNSGYVILNWNSDTNVASKMYLGGVVGMMAGDGAISGCVNEGGESNAGEVYVNVKASTAVGHTDNYAGGILGYTDKNVAISDCTNSGYVHGGNSSNGGSSESQFTFYCGGIVAYLAGKSSITNCINSGNVYNNQWNNVGDPATSFVYNGGIAGYVKGTSGDVITMTGCEHNTSDLSPRRGLSGGIVGYAEYASLTNCNTKATNFGGSAWYIGGIAGMAANSTISSCTWSGTTINTSQIRANGGGGIVALLENSVIDGCYSYATTIQKNSAGTYGGGIVGTSGEGNTIQNCHYTATLNTIAATGTFTGEGNVADL